MLGMHSPHIARYDTMEISSGPVKSGLSLKRRMVLSQRDVPHPSNENCQISNRRHAQIPLRHVPVKGLKLFTRVVVVIMVTRRYRMSNSG